MSVAGKAVGPMTHAACEHPANPSCVRAALRGFERYFWDSRRPWTVLWFVLPLVVLYEVGTITFARDCEAQTETRILAFVMMRDFLAAWGVAGRYLPCFVVIAVLLAKHLIARDAWQVDLRHTVVMWLESALLASPIFAMNGIINYYVPLLSAETRAMGAGIVLAIGAGVYEELVFRLIAFAVLTVVLASLLRLDRTVATVAVVVLSAAAFSAYHYWSAEATPFNWRDFLFRASAGVYLGVVFICRGFGITVGAHVVYDIAYFVLQPPSP